MTDDRSEATDRGRAIFDMLRLGRPTPPSSPPVVDEDDADVHPPEVEEGVGDLIPPIIVPAHPAVPDGEPAGEGADRDERPSETPRIDTPPVDTPPVIAPEVAPLRRDVGPLPPEGAFRRALPRVIAVANQKGGVGKTTTSVNLSASLAGLGYRVLLIDLDPQGNATTGVGLNPRNLEVSMYDVLLAGKSLEDCIEPTPTRNLFVAPSNLDLAGAEIELVPAMSREQKLSRALAEVQGQYDYTIIDCPPSLGLLTVNGLGAANEVLVPIQCEYYALEGLGQLLRNVSLVQQNLNPDLDVSAIVLVMFDARTNLSTEVMREVRTHFTEKVCRTVVPRTVKLSEAPSYGQPITAFAPSSRGAMAYRHLAEELSGGPADHSNPWTQETNDG